MYITDYITIDPNICHGKPCFKGTRIMVYLVLEMLAAGETPDDVIAAYPDLTKDAIAAALLFAAKTTAVSEREVPFAQPLHASVSR
ncbi:MAG: hypothetical protein Greene071436_382 [Parcubacteria group bacterium Greene0714_36]|nr:MAG: hypothetical protein Greene071436_382 [Parcubacteria group bacterium Greene0714_36]